jgi:hypothetical protein
LTKCHEKAINLGESAAEEKAPKLQFGEAEIGGGPATGS